MLWDNIIRSGHTFTADEYELESRYMLTNTIMVIIGVVLGFSFIFLFLMNILYIYLGLACIVILGALYLARKRPKGEINSLVLIINILLLMIVFEAYILKHHFHTLSSWIIIIILSSMLVSSFRLSLFITSLSVLFIFFMNDYLGYHSFEYLFVMLLPIVIAMSLVYILDKKFKYTVTLLKEQKDSLENKVNVRIKELEIEKEVLHFQAHYDSLTMLPNRIHFKQEIRLWIDHSISLKEGFSLLFLDLDKFKKVNDTFGHDAGNNVLKVIVSRINKTINKEIFFARLGGDEFVFLLRESKNINKIKTITKDIIKTVSKPILVEGSKVYLSASIGISTYPKHSIYPSDLIRYADIAMYESKKSSTCVFYDESMTYIVKKNVLLETQLHIALENNEFIVYYQPQIDMRTNKLIGLEALIRWEHPKKGLVSPNSFMDLAESVGYVTELDFNVLKQGMEQIVKWKNNGFIIPKVAFNFSAKHFENIDFFDRFKQLLNQTDCKAEWIELEIIESHIVSNFEDAVILLTRLKNLGIHITLDDFGTGYSSFKYLKLLPVEKLKIDRSFISNIPYDKVDTIITDTIISMAKNLDLEVIAEGVETEEQKEYLLSKGCFYMQGYLYAKPLSSSTLETKILTKSY